MENRKIMNLIFIKSLEAQAMKFITFPLYFFVSAIEILAAQMDFGEKEENYLCKLM